MDFMRAPLQRFWERVSSSFFAQHEEASAEKVRQFLSNQLDALPRNNYAAEKWWRPLTPREKNNLLQEAVPDGLYCREGWALIDRDGNFLTDNDELSRDRDLARRFVSDELAGWYRNAIGAIEHFNLMRWNEAESSG